MPDPIQIRATAAAQLMENSSMRQARADLRDRIYNSWVKCSDAQEREKLHSLALANEELWTILEGYLRTGDVSLSNDEKRQVPMP